MNNADNQCFFVSDYEKKEGTTAVEVKQEVEMHLKEKDIIEATIPGNILIGPFWVNTENVKQTLSKKRKNLSNAMLELLARKLRNQADDVNQFILTKIIFLFKFYCLWKVNLKRRINNHNSDETDSMSGRFFFVDGGFFKFEVLIWQACEEFKEINRKLYNKPNCVEELSDMREWMKGIPERLQEHQVLLHHSYF